MPETQIFMTPFNNCPFLYQAVIKLSEETGEVSQAFYSADIKKAEDITKEDMDKFVEECGDVMQAAFNIIVRCGYDVQDIIDKVTEKNMSRGYYNAE